MNQGLVAYRATGAELLRSHFLTLLAEACAKAGQTATALATLSEAVAVSEQTRECLYEPELHRVKGDLTLLEHCGSGETNEAASHAEACFLQAIGKARQRGAQSLELRAVIALSRMWERQGKCAEARALLSEIYGRFGEGFDTDDLREAKALLATL
jgi:predicted ATPase